MSLTQKHRIELEEGSGIRPDVIEARGYRSIDRVHPNSPSAGGPMDEGPWLRRMNFSRAATDPDNGTLWPILWIPTFNPKGTWSQSGQIKPNRPVKKNDGREIKYVNPAGKAVQLDVHPWHKDKATDPTVPMWVVEGVKKADCLTSHLTDGSMVVAIPGVYSWRSRTQTLGDWEDIVIRGREVVICFDSDARHNRMVSEAMRRFGDWLRGKGASKVTYALPPEVWQGQPVKGVDDLIVAGGALENLEYAKRPPLIIDVMFSDRGLAEKAAEELFRNRFCWTPSSGWMEYSGGLWSETDDAHVREVLGQWLADKCAQALRDRGNNKTSSDDVKGWQTTLQYGKVRAVVEVLKGMLLEDLADFDANPDLLNCPNGVVDLRSGKLLPHDPLYNMTKCTSVPYVEGCVHPDWEKALQAVPDDVKEWFHLRMGQAITGRRLHTDQAVFLHADGNNGKSTVLDLTTKCVGDYATSISEAALLAAGKDAGRASATPELMAFRGARYAFIEETPEAGRLSSARLKRLNGTRVITARPLYKDVVSFVATHTLFVSTNYRPMVDQGDHGTWRRLLLMTFPYTYVPEFEADGRTPRQLNPETERVMDPEFRDRVTADPEVQKAVLAWMVEGARKSYDGLGEVPTRIMEDSTGWRQVSDPVLRFTEQHVKFERGYAVSAMELFTLFNEMLTTEGHQPWSIVKFSARFVRTESALKGMVETRKVRPQSIDERLSTRTGIDVSKPIAIYLNVRFAQDEKASAI